MHAHSGIVSGGGERGWHTSVGCFLPWTKMKIVWCHSIRLLKPELTCMRWNMNHNWLLKVNIKVETWKWESRSRTYASTWSLCLLSFVAFDVIKKFIHTSIFMRKHFEHDAMCARVYVPHAKRAPIPFDEYQIFKSNKLNSDKYFYFMQLFFCCERAQKFNPFLFSSSSASFEQFGRLVLLLLWIYDLFDADEGHKRTDDHFHKQNDYFNSQLSNSFQKFTTDPGCMRLVRDTWHFPRLHSFRYWL